MDVSDKSVKISGEVVLRCPKCKAVAAWERFDGPEHHRSWNQRYKLALSSTWPFFAWLPVPHEPKCPNGCDLEN